MWSRLLLCLCLAALTAACERPMLTEADDPTVRVHREDLVEVTGSDDGVVNFPGAATAIRITNPVGSVVVNGTRSRAEGRLPWYLDRSVFAPTESEASQQLQYVGPAFGLDGTTFLVQVEAPARSDELDVAALIQLVGFYDVPVTVTEADEVFADALAETIIIEQARTARLTRHAAGCDLLADELLEVSFSELGEATCEGTSGGDVVVRVPAGTDAVFDLQSRSGTVHVTPSLGPLFDLETSRSARGRLGTGDGILRFTAEGDITLARTTTSG